MMQSTHVHVDNEIGYDVSNSGAGLCYSGVEAEKVLVLLERA
jgi:hypothetical protein